MVQARVQECNKSCGVVEFGEDDGGVVRLGEGDDVSVWTELMIAVCVLIT